MGAASSSRAGQDLSESDAKLKDKVSPARSRQIERAMYILMKNNRSSVKGVRGFLDDQGRDAVFTRIQVDPPRYIFVPASDFNLADTIPLNGIWMASTQTYPTTLDVLAEIYAEPQLNKIMGTSELKGITLRTLPIHQQAGLEAWVSGPSTAPYEAGGSTTVMPIGENAGVYLVSTPGRNYRIAVRVDYHCALRLDHREAPMRGLTTLCN